MSPSFRAEPRALLRSAGTRALERPWLLAPPLAGVLARHSIGAALAGDAGAASGTLIGAAVTIAACAAFAELWLTDGRARWPRVGAALALYVLPMLVLMFVGLAASEVFFLGFRSGPAADARALILATIVAGKLASGAATVLVSLALARWSGERGLLGALRDGAGLFAANAGLCVVLVLGSWLAQEAAGYALGSALAASGSPEFFQVFGVLGEAIVAGIALAGCVALPLQAGAEAR